MIYKNSTTEEIIKKVVSNFETDLNYFKDQTEHLNIYEKGTGKYYLTSYDRDGNEKQIYNEQTKKGSPEEIIRQLLLFYLIDELGYPKERVEIEKTVSFGREVKKKKADVVIYGEDLTTPWLVAEVKAIGEKNNFQQFKSYVNGEGSPIGVITNGEELFAFLRPYPREFESLADSIPSFENYEQVKNSDNPLDELLKVVEEKDYTLEELKEDNKKNTPDLKKVITRLEELVLANSGAEVFSEIFKLIYAKLYDEWENETGESHKLRFRKYYHADTTQKEIEKLFEESKKEWKEIFDETEKIKLSPNHLQICVKSFEKIQLFDSNLRIIDEAFEYLVPEVAKSKKGQYFTPRVVIDMCVMMLNPSNKEYVLDPSCGSAGFLVHTMKYIWGKYNLSNFQAKSRYATRYIWGIDFDERSTKISKAIMLIAGDGKSHVYRENSLDFKNWKAALVDDLKKEELIESGNKQLNFDVILANPPFAGEINEQDLIRQYNDILHTKTSKVGIQKKEAKEVLKDEQVAELQEYVKEFTQDVQYGDFEEYRIQTKSAVIEYLNENFNLTEDEAESLFDISAVSKQASDYQKISRHILFIQRIIDMLKEGGRAGIVLPQGIFNNSGEKYIRDYLFDKARILAVVGLHANSFKPHTGTKTSVLFVRKLTEEQKRNTNYLENYEIPFFTSKIGFKNNSGDYVFLQDENGQDIKAEESKFPYFAGDKIYQTDLFVIAEAFQKWGFEQYKKGDKFFDFLEN
ncbi:N-6 DNA methylase [Candidatus Gracilibacteria bacterium]|nr:N-6 DNA methylase [Candidatus Gracilibacteria bacterium]MCF7819312.1 N-6 DNA methylase [Candidatus Gracilibacteria bacterium]